MPEYSRIGLMEGTGSVTKITQPIVSIKRKRQKPNNYEGI